MKILLWLGWVAGVGAAGNVKLLRMGEQVEQNPLTVTIMFAFVVVLTIAIETLKHSIEHRVHDKGRKEGIEVVTVQLMIIGLVSFVLISAAEFGLTDIRLPIGGCETSGSGSGSNETTEICGVGFDIQIFEFARMVLFFMGLAYCCFIFIGFNYRDKVYGDIQEIEKESLHSYAAGSQAGGSTYFQRKKFRYAARLLIVKRAVILHNEPMLIRLCDTSLNRLKRELAIEQGKSVEMSTPCFENAGRYFRMSEFCKEAMSSSLIELLHPPWFIWLTVTILTFQTSLVKKFSEANQADTMAYTAFIGPISSLLLLYFLRSKFKSFENGVVGHPEMFTSEYRHATPPPPTTPYYTVSFPMGSHWHEGGTHPWETLRTSTDINPRPHVVTHLIQGIVFCNCFYIGMLILLSGVVAEQGRALLAVCWVAPLFSLRFLVPQCILYYTLLYKTESPVQNWVQRGLEYQGPPEEGEKIVEEKVPNNISFTPSMAQYVGEELEEGLLTAPRPDEPPPVPVMPGRGRRRGGSRTTFLNWEGNGSGGGGGGGSCLTPLASPSSTAIATPFPSRRHRQASLNTAGAIPIPFTPPVRVISPSPRPRSPNPRAYARSRTPTRSMTPPRSRSPLNIVSY